MLRRFAFFCGCEEHVQQVHHRPPCGVCVRCNLRRNIARSCFIRCVGATAQWSEHSKFGSNDSFLLTSLTVEPLQWSTRWFVRAAPPCAQAFREEVPAASSTVTGKVRIATSRVFIKSNSRLIDHCTLQQRSTITTDLSERNCWVHASRNVLSFLSSRSEGWPVIVRNNNDHCWLIWTPLRSTRHRLECELY